MTTPFRPLRSAGYALLAGLFLLPAINAEASFDPSKNSSIRVTHHSQSGSNLNGTTNGGEFRLTDQSGDGSSIITFCLEKSEVISPNEVVRSGGVGDYSVWGGDDSQHLGNDNFGRIVETQTRFLYASYLDFNDNAASGFDGLTNWASASSDERANAVQQAIWYFQGQNQGLLAGLMTDIVNRANSWTNNGNIDEDFGVSALNLFKSDADTAVPAFWNNFNSGDTSTFGSKINSIARQDMLFRATDAPSSAIPEPSTIAVWSLAMFGLVVAGRRRLKARVA